MRPSSIASTPENEFSGIERAVAAELDTQDPLAPFRSRFFVQPGEIYLDGNSLGLQSIDAQRSVSRIMAEWRTLGIGGWLDGERPWFSFAEELGALAAPLIGASGDEVIATGTTTLNVHACVGSLYRPTSQRDKIVAAADDFPTDIYALKSQLKLKGRDPRQALVLIESDDRGRVEEASIISKLTDDVALVLLPAVFYRSGQLLDLQRLTEAAHERGICIGFDCSHSVGAVPHRFDVWGVDFAVWCSYKYLNAGPGSPAFIYLNKRHFGLEPSLAGWFGYNKKKQFDLLIDFEPASTAGCMQISSPGILGAAAIEGALAITLEAGIERIRRKSLQLTDYLMFLIDKLLPTGTDGFSIVNPREAGHRGGHVALSHSREGKRICDALRGRKIITDFRPPDVIRIAPVALYNTFEDVWQTVNALQEIVATAEYESFEKTRGLIT